MNAKYVFLTLLLGMFQSLHAVGQEGPPRGRRGEGDRRSFDIGALMARIDVNKNGILDNEELNDRSRDFLRRMGMENLGDSVAVADVIKAYEERNGQGNSAAAKPAQTTREQASSDLAAVRKLPGFDAPVAQASSLPKFNVLATAAPGLKPYDSYPESVKAEVENTLRRYDSNKDGVIDTEEMKAMRWRAPSAAESDLNRDGTLTREEIAHRYLQRESATNEGTSEGSGNRGGPGRGDRFGRDDGRSNDSRGGDNRGEERRGGDPNAAGGNATSTTSTSSSSASSGGTDYRTYASEILQKYDENNDGVLDKDEFAKLRRKPPNADADKDGLVTLGELIDAYTQMERVGGTGTSGSSSGSSASSGGDSNSSRNDRGSRTSSSGRGSSSGGRSDSGGPFSIDRYDKNRDGQVQMWEFADEWTKEILEEFRKWDKNNDGVITLDEVRNR